MSVNTFAGTFALVASILSSFQTYAASCARETNVEIIDCLNRELAKSESRLLVAYKKALAAQTQPKWHDLVVSSQRLWIASREKDCRGLVSSQWEGGSGQGTAIASCLITKDDARSSELAVLSSGG